MNNLIPKYFSPFKLFPWAKFTSVSFRIFVAILPKFFPEG